MALNIRLWNETSWIIDIKDESWQVENKEELMKLLKQLIDFKEKYGKRR